MAKVIIWNLVTLDGFFEGEKKWDLDFHNRAWGPELEALSSKFGAAAGLLVFGRVTYEGMKAYWTTAQEEGEVKAYMNALPKLVASRTITSSDWNNTEVTADIIGEIARRKRMLDKTIYVFGSADLSDGLLEAGLVDEVMLAIVPVQLGKGTPFFKEGTRRDFDLIEAKPLSNGAVLTRYAPQSGTR
ncbi:dihydrofolate reductase family protein [Shinella sp. CPCC 101442]|uniref:dihydrofolate reductase family protein n=1 Tax=Shinella sp. CPCC 101442 TaxID=2932265 RepID=UPI002152CC4E|nr:dihydrofolate reductase family protein [Shinella sp. CPCC 101442]MCR6500889.1 dihydrofolate reductase family protein [Shinella sp. CPCC 101442]